MTETCTQSALGLCKAPRSRGSFLTKSCRRSGRSVAVRCTEPHAACSPELIYHYFDRRRIFFKRSDDVRSNPQCSIVTALRPINAELFSKSENILPRHTELFANLLI